MKQRESWTERDMFPCNINTSSQKDFFHIGVTWSDEHQELIHSDHTEIKLVEERIEAICEDVEITSMSIFNGAL